MAQINSTDGFTLHGWMVTELHLAGGDLFAFALVHQFSQSHAGVYYGNTDYLASWTGWSENTCRKYLTNLVEAGLIVPVRGREDNIPFCHYKLAPDFYKKHPSKFAGSPLKNCGHSTSKSAVKAPQNLREEYNNSEINVVNSVSTTSLHKNACVRENPPTEKEIEDYVRGRGFADPAGFAAYYLTYQTEAGWMTGKGKGRKPIDNWKLNVLAWEPNHKFTTYNSPTPNAPSPKKHLSRADQAFENMMALGRELGIIGDNKNTPDYEQQ